MADWDSERIEHAHLRERLNDIAAEVSRLADRTRAAGRPMPAEASSSSVQRFADGRPRAQDRSVSAAHGA